MTELPAWQGVAQWAERAADLALTAGRRALTHVEGLRPAYVVAGFVVAEWLLTLAVASKVRHKGWLWYHGGDQVWFYTTSWLLGHGQLVPTYVGYGWSVLELPISLVSGPNLLQALPAIVLLNVFVLMPIAMAAMYGIGERLGGRIFGYWVLALWLALPFVGIWYTEPGFHQRYTELALPDAFGLTSLSDFPSMVMLTLAAYFCLRTIQRFDWTDGLLAGVFAGFALGIKPSSSLFLGGATLAFLAYRRWRGLEAFALGFAPAIVALAVWKWRGLGYLPVFHAEQSIRLALGAGPHPLAALNLKKYFSLDWGQLNQVRLSLREHFWSERVVEWVLVAGLLGLARRSFAALALFGGWFLAFFVVKGTQNIASLESGALLHGLVQAIPGFVLMVAAVTFLVPRLPRRVPTPPPPRRWGSPGLRRTLLTAGVLLFAVAPIALAVAATPVRAEDKSWVYNEAGGGPIPVDKAVSLRAHTRGGAVTLRWSAEHAAGSPLFYGVERGDCSSNAGQSCIVGLTHGESYVDRPPPGAHRYRLLIGGNWLDDPLYGDWYLAGTWIDVSVP
jgi:hypothetical protein